MAHHHLLEVGCIELLWLKLADTVIPCKIMAKGLTVAQLVGNDTTVTQHAALVHRVLEHLLRQTVKTCHCFSRTLETERLGQREIHIERSHRILLYIYVLQRTPEELLAYLRLVAAIIEKAHPHVCNIEILLLMALFDVVGNIVNLGKGTMEVFMVHVIYHAIHPRTVEHRPVLAPLQIVHECLVRLVEIGVAAIHLRFIEPLDHCLLLI